MKKDVLLISTSSSGIFCFRKGLVDALIDNGYNVHIFSTDNKFKNEIEKWDVEFSNINQSGRSVNPLKKIEFYLGIKEKITNINPEIVMTFQATSNIFGVLAAKKCKVKRIFSMVEGAGDPFVYNNAKWLTIRAILCFLYRISFRYVKKVFFLNEDDRKEFIKRKIVKDEQSTVIKGIGIDLEKFEYTPIYNNNMFLMISRMMPAKGVIEFCKAAEIVKKKYPYIKFVYIGEEYTLNKGDIIKYIDEGIIDYLGYQNDVSKYIKDCFCYVLPSFYREGLPVTIMEASAIGRPIITTNNVGCKDAVIDGATGFIIEKKNIFELCEKMEYLINNIEVTYEMGKNARIFAQNNFDQKIINKKIIKIIEGKYETI